MFFFLTRSSVCGSPAMTLIRSTRRSSAKVPTGSESVSFHSPQSARIARARNDQPDGLSNRGPQFSTRTLRMVKARNCPWTLLYLSFLRIARDASVELLSSVARGREMGRVAYLARQSLITDRLHGAPVV